MNNRCWVRLLLLGISTVSVFSRVSLAGEATWIEVRSPHFSVITDAGERRGREVATRFEQMRAVFANLITNAKVNLPIPLQIVAFRSTKELRQVSPLWHGKPVEVAGLFQPGSDRCFIMLDMAVENPWAVVFHEYAGCPTSRLTLEPQRNIASSSTEPEGAPFLAFFARSGAFASRSRPNLHL